CYLSFILFYFLLFFFFQAEDGIRDRNVTGVQTCALPILVSDFFSPYLLTFTASSEISWSPTTNVKGIFFVCASRILKPILSSRSSTSTRIPSIRHLSCTRLA